MKQIFEFLIFNLRLPLPGRKKKGNCVTAITAKAVATLLVTLSLLCMGLPARAQFLRVAFTNSAFPTAYAPSVTFTNNGTNSGFSAPVYMTITNATLWTSSYYVPSNSAVVRYIGKDWLPQLPVTLVLGITQTGGSAGNFTNYLTFSPDGNYWTPSNTVAMSCANGPVSQTNWFSTILTAGSQTNMAYVAWDGCSSTSATAVEVVWWGYQVYHPTASRYTGVHLATLLMQQEARPQRSRFIRLTPMYSNVLMPRDVGTASISPKLREQRLLLYQGS